MRIWWWILVPLVLILAACGRLETVPVNSGIEGQIIIGPMCPVERPGESCPDRPFQAEVTVLGRNGNVAAIFRSDDQGRFRLDLAPGTYTLVPKTYGIQRAPETKVVVRRNEFSAVTIRYDSGIR